MVWLDWFLAVALVLATLVNWVYDLRLRHHERQLAQKVEHHRQQVAQLVALANTTTKELDEALPIGLGKGGKGRA